MSSSFHTELDNTVLRPGSEHSSNIASRLNSMFSHHNLNYRIPSSHQIHYQDLLSLIDQMASDLTLSTKTIHALASTNEALKEELRFEKDTMEARINQLEIQNDNYSIQNQ